MMLWPKGSLFAIGPDYFHEKAGRGQGILRFFLSLSLFPFR
jgi:hypothetical protein